MARFVRCYNSAIWWRSERKRTSRRHRRLVESDPKCDVVGPKPQSEQASIAHLRLEIDAESMSDEERKVAAEALRRALEKGAPDLR
jgi:hypothetical protein